MESKIYFEKGHDRMVKLSIVVPTYNRVNYLKETIDSLFFQVKQFNDVELVVVDNCSDNELPIGYFEKKSIKYYHRNHKLDVGESIQQSVNFANGDFIIIFGDDDIPLPGFVKKCLDIIESRDFGLCIFNKLVGFEDNLVLKGCYIDDNSISDNLQRLNDINIVLKDYFLRFSFISVVLFRKSYFKKSETIFNCEVYTGYNFLMQFCYSARQGTIYCSLPLVVQRRHKKVDWSYLWPRYYLNSLPNIIEDFSKYDSSVTITWQKDIQRFRRFIFAIINAKKFNKQYNLLELLKYQNKLNFVVGYILFFITPKNTMDIIRKFQFLMKK